MSPTPAVMRLRADASILLDRIADLFRSPVRLTLYVRVPTHPDGSHDFMLTEDSVDVICDGLRQLERVGNVTQPDPRAAAPESGQPSEEPRP